MQGEDIQLVITDGFISRDSLTTVDFAKSERQANGHYNFMIGHRGQELCQYSSGWSDLGFLEALELLDKWERDQLPTLKARVKSGEYGLEAPNFRVVAKEMGILVGPEEKSLYHAARIKQAARARHRIRKQQPG